MPETLDLPLASSLLEILGNEETSPGVKRSARMLYADLVAAAGGAGVFGPVGTAHSTGSVPDPGLTPATTDRVLFDDATWGQGSKLRLAAAYDADPLGTGYNGQVWDLADLGVQADYLQFGGLNATPTDNAALLQDIFNSLGNFDHLIWPEGYVGYNSPIFIPDDLSGIAHTARGGYANLVKNFNTTNDQVCFTLNPFGARVEDLWCWSGASKTGGVLMGHVASGGAAGAEQWRIRNVVFTGFSGGLPYGDFAIDASDGPPNYGSRESHVANCVFHGSYTGFGARTGGNNDLLFIGSDFVNAGVATIDFWCTGASNNPTNTPVIIGASLDHVNIDYMNGGVIMTGATGNIDITAHAVSNLLLVAFVSGTVTNNGVSTRIITPLMTLTNAADDTAAAGAGIEVGEFYRTASAVKIRVA